MRSGGIDAGGKEMTDVQATKRATFQNTIHSLKAHFAHLRFSGRHSPLAHSLTKPLTPIPISTYLIRSIIEHPNGIFLSGVSGRAILKRRWIAVRSLQKR
jgi:hypothetical protein